MGESEERKALRLLSLKEEDLQSRKKTLLREHEEIMSLARETDASLEEDAALNPRDTAYAEMRDASRADTDRMEAAFQEAIDRVTKEIVETQEAWEEQKKKLCDAEAK